MSSRDKDIFLKAVEIQDSGARQAFLEQACLNDQQLLSQVSALLRSSDSAGEFLETPAIVSQFDIDYENHDSDSNAFSFLTPSENSDTLGRIGHFEVEYLLGEGGTGLVFKAFDSRLNRSVAIKVLSPLIAAHRSARMRFLREAHAAAAITHPYVTAIYAIDEHQQLPYLVMEFIEGSTLDQEIIKQGQLSLELTIRTGMQIAEGLAAAHEKGLIHRDIKPANVLLMKNSRQVKITDFGLARAIDDGKVTQNGYFSGTPQYMSPEQATGQPLDQRTDLFSLGCVLYAMCTGSSPFKADTTIASIRSLCDLAPSPIRQINPSTPGWLVDLISRLLEKRPADRYQSAEKVSDILAAEFHQLQHADIDNSQGSQSSVEQAQHERPRKVASHFQTLLTVLFLAAFFLFALSEFTGFSNLLYNNRIPTTDTATKPPAKLDEIFFETLTSNEYGWTEPTNLGEMINSEFDELYPRLSADGLLLVYSSDRPTPSGENHGSDIWMASRLSMHEPFGEPTRLGSAINSRASEIHPTISGNGLIMVFARPGSNGTEFWQSTRESLDSPWQQAVNLGPGLKGPHNRNAFANLSSDGLVLDFSSHLQGGGPCVAMRSVRKAVADPWPPAKELRLTSDLPVPEFITMNMVSGNDLAAVMYCHGQGRRLFVRETPQADWVKHGMDDYQDLRPQHLEEIGTALERFFSADGSSMVYAAHWDAGYGRSDIWMVQRVKR